MSPPEYCGLHRPFFRGVFFDALTAAVSFASSCFAAAIPEKFGMIKPPSVDRSDLSVPSRLATLSDSVESTAWCVRLRPSARYEGFATPAVYAFTSATIVARTDFNFANRLAMASFIETLSAATCSTSVNGVVVPPSPPLFPPGYVPPVPGSGFLPGPARAGIGRGSIHKIEVPEGRRRGLGVGMACKPPCPGPASPAPTSSSAASASRSRRRCCNSR